VSKFFNIYTALGVCTILIQTSNAFSSERLLEANIEAGAEVNDNVFLTTLPHDTVKGIIISPSLSGVIREENWEGNLRARIKSYNYSDKNLDSNDQYFDLTGRYLADRNIFSLNINHDLASNLSSTSSDFGLVARRVNTKRQSISPQYTRLLTERFVLSLSYTYTDVDFLEANDTAFTPYITETGSGSLIYDLTEKDKLTISLTAVDYTSRNKLVTYQLFMSRIGVEHNFSETLSTDFLIGVSRRSSTNLQTQSFDFFGRPITINQEIDAKDRGLVMDAGITQLLENGQMSGRISRDNTANSFGGLDQTDQLKIKYANTASALWEYSINGRYENIASISSDSRNTDRKVFFFDAIAYYSISRNWRMNLTYTYTVRKFKSDTSNTNAPHSNRVYVSLTYNFPSLSTF